MFLLRCFCRQKQPCTAAATTTRSPFGIEDLALGPGRVDVSAPVEGFGVEGTPKLKIQRDPFPQKESLICGPPLYKFSESGTTWHSNWSLGLILGAFYTTFRAGPVGAGLELLCTSVRFRCFPGSNLAKIQPGRPISGPEALA